MSKLDKMIEYLREDGQWHTSEEIALYLGVTSRTIKNYAKQLSNIDAFESGRNGYRISLTEKEKFWHTEQQTLESGRVNTIINLLIQSTEPLNLYDLTEYLALSETPVLAALKQVANKIEIYGLEVEHENNHWYIKGNERNKRRMLSSLLYEESAGKFLSIDLLQNTFPEIDILEIRNVIKQVALQNDIRLNAYELSNLMLHIAIAIDRSPNRINKKISVNINSAFTNELLDKIENIVNMNFSNEDRIELAQIIELITCSKENAIIDGRIRFLVDEIILYINDTYQVDLNSEKFKIQFSVHLKKLIERAKANSYARNPMLERIKNTSPTIYECAVLISHKISEQWGIQISDDEISFIALHIGNILSEQITNKDKLGVVILIPEYHDNTENLLEKIQNRFGEVLAIHKIAHDIFDVNFDNIDLVIQADTQFDIGNIPTVIVSQFLLPQDIARLNVAITSIRANLKKNKLRMMLDKFIAPQHFLYVNELKSQEEVFEDITRSFESDGIVSSKFSNKLTKREALSSTAFGNVALPHTLEMDAKKSKGMIYINPKGVKWTNGEIVYLIIALAVAKDNQLIFREVFDELSIIITDREKVSKLIKNKTYEDFMLNLLNFD